MSVCDYCGKNESSEDVCIIINGTRHVYHFCSQCSQHIQSSGRNVYELMQEKLGEIGKVCRVCGCTLEEFERTMLFGCPECYKNMREAAFRATERLQGTVFHTGKRL